MNAEQAASTTVKRTVRVNAPVEKAFQVFTGRIGAWWPAAHHIGAAPLADVVMEPRAGGRWYEKGTDGKECDWGRVLVWEPPHRIVLAWGLQPDWTYSPDAARASEVSVEFFAEGAAATRVELEHRLLERHGADYEKLRAGVDSPDGWPGILARYAETAAKL